jgi:hypothetical protein
MKIGNSPNRNHNHRLYGDGVHLPCLEAQYWGAMEKGYKAAEDAVMTMLGLKSCGDAMAVEARERWVLRA